MSVSELTKNEFEEKIALSEKPVLIDFFAEWCGPCKMQSPVIELLAAEHEEILFCKVNVDAEPELAQAFGIVSIPTLIAMKGGKVTGKAVGYRAKDEILALLEG